MNVIEIIKAHLSPDLIARASRFLGESEASTSKGFETGIPALLAGVLNAIEEKDKIIPIWDLIQDQQNDPEILSHLTELFDGNSKHTSNTSLGESLLAHLFEGKSTVLHSINSLAGFQNVGSAGKVLSIAAPLVLASLRNKAEISDLGMAGLLKWLLDNKQNILGSLPNGWTSQMGLIHLMYSKDHDHSGGSETSVPTSRFWWLWILAIMALVGGLWVGVKSCNQTEMVDRFTGAIKNAKAVLDSTSIEAENAAKLAKEGLDSAAQVFKSKWTALGKSINIRLGDSTLSLPEKGVELKLVEWIQNKANEIDKTTWFNFDRILFQTGSASLNKVSDEQIKNIATIMKAMPSLEFKIGGYTDNTGDPVANVKLSMERAEAVKNALVEKGIDVKRLEAEGYGPEFPAADNATEEGREQNRRVAIRVTKK